MYVMHAMYTPHTDIQCHVSSTNTLFVYGCTCSECMSYLPSLLTHFVVCRVNAISNARVMGDDYNEGIFGKKAARVWLFFGFLFTFVGLIGSLWVFIQVFLVPGECTVG